MTEREFYKLPNVNSINDRMALASAIYMCYNTVMKMYRKRIADEILAKKLASMGAVLVEGPKWCGKTTTAEHIAKSVLYMSEPSQLDYNLMLASTDPKSLLAGETPRLIDEWQLAPSLWDAARFEVDHRDGVGHFIFTGSSVPPSLDKIKHTGTGRFARLKMRPMSLFESGESTGAISLQLLFDGVVQHGQSTLKFDDLAYLICRGGWPHALELSPENALLLASEYYEAVVESDVSRVDDVRRDPERIKRLIRSYARHQGAQASTGVICEDMRANDSTSLDSDTVLSYINVLKKIFVVEDTLAWSPNLRSKTAIRTSDTRYFVDPSIGVAALGLGPQDFKNDLNTMGLLFETLCMRDLRVYADALGGQVYHYRDSLGLECDAVIHLRNGAYGLIEIKLGGDQAIADGVQSLKKLANRIDTTRMKEPSFLAVLTGVGTAAYRREDGVYVIPIGTLRP